MPIISRNVPAFTNDNCNGGGPASNGNDADYDSTWITCQGAPSAASPKWLAYDLSGVPAAKRTDLVVGWFNDPMTSPFDHTVLGEPAYNNVGSYTIEVNPAAGGGSAPTTGWVTKVTVSANKLNSRQHLLTGLTGVNWIRIRVTASDGSSGNNGVAINFDVHDASGGANDDWIFYGDSITQDGLAHDTRVAKGGTRVGTFAQLVNARAPGFFPLFQNAGIGSETSGSGAGRVPGWLAQFPGRYVALDYGRTDAGGEANDPSIVKPFHDHMAAMIQMVLDAGKVPILPTLPWGRDPALQANVPVLNNEIRKLATEYPKAVLGPDLYAVFNADHTLISNDNIHPTWDAGYAALRVAWADWAASTIYP
jgi:hypothetical protein